MKALKLLIINSIIILVGCSKELNTEDIGPQNVNSLAGKVEKGPFTQGSIVTIQELNKHLALTGKSFQTDITNNEGDFKIESAIELVSPFIEIACDGYFFNEVKGVLSNSQIRLECIANIANKKNININILTHLSKGRIINLIKEEGYSYKEAALQAREELLISFGLQEYKEFEFEDMSISSGKKGSGVLIMISSILLANRSEAELTEYISSLKETFTATGTFPNSVIQSFRDQSHKLNISDITSKIINRYKDLGKKILIPDLKYYIDWDGDGIAGNELGDPNIEKQLFFEIDTLYVSKAGGEFRVRIHSNVPFSRYPNNSIHNDNPNIIDAHTYLKDIEFTDTTIVDNELLIKITPTSEPFLKPTIITVNTLDNSLISDLTIVQEGDFSNELSNKYISALISQAASAFDYTHTIEALYSNCYSTNSSQWNLFSSHTISADNKNINNAWISLYKLNKAINSLQKLVGEKSSKYLVSLRSLIYYHLTTLWGDVPYVNQLNEEYYPTRTAITDISFSLKKQLEKNINKLSNENIGSFFQVSQNVPKALLAKILIQQNKYSDALKLLQDIISSGLYDLNNNIDAALSSNSTEMIYAVNKETFPTTNHTKYIAQDKYLPLIQYSEIILLAAECSYKIGNRKGAINYLNQVRKRNGKNLATLDSFEIDLKETWKNTLKGGFSYLNFLKRNNLIINELNIQEFQKILPIPSSEMEYNPNTYQNPGY